MLCGMGAIASWPEEATSFQARVPAAPSSVLPKSARLQNTNKIHWPFPQQLLCSSESQHRKASLWLHWSLCLPADSERSQPTWLSHHIWACCCQKEVYLQHATDPGGINNAFFEHSGWHHNTQNSHILDIESVMKVALLWVTSCFHWCWIILTLYPCSGICWTPVTVGMHSTRVRNMLLYCWLYVCCAFCNSVHTTKDSSNVEMAGTLQRICWLSWYGNLLQTKPEVVLLRILAVSHTVSADLEGNEYSKPCVIHMSTFLRYQSYRGHITCSVYKLAFMPCSGRDVGGVTSWVTKPPSQRPRSTFTSGHFPAVFMVTNMIFSSP